MVLDTDVSIEERDMPLMLQTCNLETPFLYMYPGTFYKKKIPEIIGNSLNQWKLFHVPLGADDQTAPEAVVTVM